jgi:hypothetical protein
MLNGPSDWWNPQNAAIKECAAIGCRQLKCYITQISRARKGDAF